jgi:glutathione S-transferase
MHKLTQFRLCPQSRSIRLALEEAGIEATLADERPWEWRTGLLALNPAGELPILEVDSGAVLCGAYAISEFLDEELDRRPAGRGEARLFPGNGEDRAEVRRLVDWFHRKMEREVTRELLLEKVYPRTQSDGVAAAPDPGILRAIRANLRYHLSYVGYLAEARRWLGGDELSFADLAAAAHVSTLDYLGEVPWDSHPHVKSWYVRLKSRKSFRPLLADRVPGLHPPQAYADLDF